MTKPPTFNAAQYRQVAPGSSAVYCLGIKDGVAAANPFNGTQVVTWPRDGHSPGVDVFAADPARVLCAYDDQRDIAIYLIGHAVHPSLHSDAMLRWAGRAAIDSPEELLQLSGLFALIVDERAGRRVHFVTDLLGVQPWFVGSSHGRLVGGTDVMGICDAGLSRRQVDLDSLSSWLCYNFIAGGGSVVTDYRRAARGAVTSYCTDGGRCDQRSYATIRYTDEPISPDDLVDSLYHAASKSFDLLVRDCREITLPLSGGFDSRLIAAWLARRPDVRVHAATVANSRAESETAAKVASALKLDWRLIDPGGNIIDAYADPFWFRPEGFPTARNLTSLVTRRHPGVPAFSGFLGDILMRDVSLATTKAFFALDDQRANETTMVDRSHTRYFDGRNRLDLMQSALRDRIIARGRERLACVIRECVPTGRPIATTNMLLRHGNYFAGIFLSHQDTAGARLPYYHWPVLQYRLRHTPVYPSDSYERMFKRYHPEIDGIPHEADLNHPKPVPAPSRHLPGWSADLVRSWAAGTLAGIDRRKAMQRVAQLLIDPRRYGPEVGFLFRVHLLQSRLRSAGIEIPWNHL